MEDSTGQAENCNLDYNYSYNTILMQGNTQGLK